jgi:hypothetical protein
MSIPRKPERKSENPDDFIKTAPTKNINLNNDEKKGRKITSLSLMISDAEWISSTVKEINKITTRQITRSELISTAISLLKDKDIQDVIKIIRNR